jgi:hypothetical protein
MSIVKRSTVETALTRFRNPIAPNTVKCLRQVNFELSELKKLVAAMEVYNKTQPVASRVTQVKCMVIAEQPVGGTLQLNMFMTSRGRDFNLDSVAADTEVVLGRPCPPHCTTDMGALPDHYLSN